jgi:hypothetical protein
MVSIKLKGREIPLIYTVLEMKTIQEEIGPLDKAINYLMGKDPEKEGEEKSIAGSPEHIETVAKTVRILGNAGLEEAGEEPDLTDRLVLRSMKPNEFANAMNKCIEAMNEAMQSEIPEKKSEEPVDVTLAEIKKKKAKES